MAEQQVARLNTPVSEAEMARAFLDQAQALFGITLTKPQLAIVMAQNNLETGHRKSMFNFNIGNITHVRGDGHDYFLSGDSTKRNGKWVAHTVPFRAYPTLADGAKDYLSNLHKRGGGSVWQGVMQADPAYFSKALKQTNYYEADEDKYTAGIVAGTKSFTKSDAYEQAVAAGPTVSSTIGTPATGAIAAGTLDKLEGLLDQFLAALSSDQRPSQPLLKRADRAQLTSYPLLIKLQANRPENAAEFARILCTALEEELSATAYPHTDRQHLEVECSVPGPWPLCLQATTQLCQSLSNTFQRATHPIGGCQVQATICPNRQSNYPLLGISLASHYYNQFHLQFVKAANGH